MKILYSLIISLLICLTALPSWAAVAVQSVTNATNNSGSTTNTQSLVVNAGSNLAIIACLPTSSAGAGSSATGVTFNGSEAFTSLGATGIGWVGGVTTYVSVWGLANPTVTTANVVATWGTSTNDRTQAPIYLVLTGVDSAIKDVSGVAVSGTATSPITVDVTTTVVDAFIVDCALSDLNGAPTVGANQTSRTNGIVGNGFNARLMSTEVATSTGTYTMDWTQSVEEWATVAVAIKPYVAPVASAGGGGGAAFLLLGAP